MQEKEGSFFNKSIAFCFYLILFLVPLVMSPVTFELFEFNKMWLVFMLTIVIGFLWLSKIIYFGKIFFKRTPFDIPILLFLIAHVVSTLFSMEPHVSFWGYYSRFNGGLLSMLAYFFLYYAFASNLTGNIRNHKQEKYGANNPDAGEIFEKKYSYKLLVVSLLSGITVALWGLPSHYGYDPTCFIFRGTFDVSCWTASFQPKVRIFSTLGQPNWLAAYLGVIVPILIAFTVSHRRMKESVQELKQKLNAAKNFNITMLTGLMLSFIELLFIDIIYTDSQSGYIGFILSLFLLVNLFIFVRFKNHDVHLQKLFTIFGLQAAFIFFLILQFYVLGVKLLLPGTLLFTVILSACIFYYLRGELSSYLLRYQPFQLLCIIILMFLATSFVIGTPVYKLDFLTYEVVKNKLSAPQQTTPSVPPDLTQEKKDEEPAPVQEFGGTDSSKIRKIVWIGALDIFRKNPVFGTGVETFAFAYYKEKPREHNLTSEWDFIYNKAHNEYLNYLATTGIFGFGSYMAIIGLFLYKAFRILLKNKNPEYKEIIGIALIASYISILISNFFGFSVVIINIYLFLIPLIFIDILQPELLKSQGKQEKREQLAFTKKYQAAPDEDNMPIKLISITVLSIVALYFEYLFIRYWVADKNYAMGYNLNKVGEYMQAYSFLDEAVKLRPSEDLFKDELATNMSTLSLIYYQQNKKDEAIDIAGKAKKLSDEVFWQHPGNVLFYKSRTRTLYALSQLDPKYSSEALTTLENARLLAPTDAKIVYNIALIYGQEENFDKAIPILEEAIDLKPNYGEAYYALALYYNQKAEKVQITNPQDAIFFKAKVKENLEYILKFISKNDTNAKTLLESIK